MKVKFPLVWLSKGKECPKAELKSPPPPQVLELGKNRSLYKSPNLYPTFIHIINLQNKNKKSSIWQKQTQKLANKNLMH